MADTNQAPTDTNPVASFFSNILKPFNLPPPFSPPASKAPQVDPQTISEASPVVDENKKPSSSIVRVPQTSQQESFPSLKVEGEVQDRESSPSTLWQVYALGGFLVLSWAWRRWNERKGSKSPEEDDPPAST